MAKGILYSTVGTRRVFVQAAWFRRTSGRTSAVRRARRLVETAGTAGTAPLKARVKGRFRALPHASFAAFVIFFLFRRSFQKKVGAPHPPDSCQAEQPFWSLGRDRGRTNNGSACRPLFLHSPHIASRSLRLSDQIRHGYDLVLDCTVTGARWSRVAGRDARCCMSLIRIRREGHKFIF